jgi:hypothetical protein
MSLTLPNVALFGTIAALAFATTTSTHTTATAEQIKTASCLNWYLLAVIVLGLVYTLFMLPSRMGARSSAMIKTYAIFTLVLYMLLASIDVTVAVWQSEAVKARHHTRASAEKITTAMHILIATSIFALALMLVPSMQFNFRMTR